MRAPQTSGNLRAASSAIAECFHPDVTWEDVAGGVGCMNSVRAGSAGLDPRVERPSRRRRSLFLSLLWSLCHLVLRRLLQLAALRLRSDEFKELEIVVLRHELAVLRRHRSRGLT
jgi:hypothetical protein